MILFLLKGVLRDRARSMFPILIVAVGVCLTIFLHSIIRGSMGDMISSTAKFDSGHVKVTTNAYKEFSEQLPNDLALLDVTELVSNLNSKYPELNWVSRIRFPGLLDIPDDNGDTRAEGIGLGLAIDLLGPNSFDKQLLNLDRALVAGTLPEESGEILLTQEFADELGVKVGEPATLVGSTMYGSLTMQNFIVVGTLEFGISYLDKGLIVADLEDIRYVLDMEDGASEILGFTRTGDIDRKLIQRVAEDFHSAEGNSDDRFAPVMSTILNDSTMGYTLLLSEYIGSILVFNFVFAMCIVLWNMSLMNGIRRYREVGIRIALGEGRRGVFRSTVVEAACIGVVGSVVGTIFGVVLAYLAQSGGLDISDVTAKANIMMPDVIHSRVTASSYYIGFIPGVFASVLGTMLAGLGIYRRQTSELFGELEV